ncbi:LysR substrate-binding domain-containing protein [Sphingobium sp. Sx8-8]|uniref:LysR substrate-binding domain-containing protein n=1 Tax=Sphingobium sp. Sx8-8 TaxID=2933617 RepID=UPI001F58DA58|nr:LysR substrate-binding domain-containing protein [Sphingobium sp. Sx8-8]
MRHLVTVAEELHFGRAAQKLNMAQPPLSQSIKRLEDELGVKLLERSRSGVSVTPAGRVFVAEARRTLMQADLTRAVTLRAAADDAASINIGFIGPAMFRLLPPIIAAYHRVPDHVELKLYDESSPNQMIGLMEGRYDVCFIHPTIDLIEGGDSVVVERCRFVAAIPEQWDLAQQESVTMAELGQLPLIMAPLSLSPNRVSSMLNAFRDVGVSPRIVQESLQTATTLSLVAANIGAALASETAILTGARGVAFRPISDLPSNLRWSIAMVWRPQHIQEGGKAFIEHVRAFSDAITQ